MTDTPPIPPVASAPTPPYWMPGDSVLSAIQRRSRPTRMLLTYLLACDFVRAQGLRAWPWNVAAALEVLNARQSDDPAQTEAPDA